MGAKAAPEVELAAHVVRHLEAEGWDVFQEVCRSGGDRRADIVALQGHLVYVVEVKNVLSFDVIAQARNWIAEAHYVSVAVPAAKPTRGRHFAEYVLRRERLGLLEVARGELLSWEPRVTVALSAQLHRHKTDALVPGLPGRDRGRYLRGLCTPERKATGQAGSNVAPFATSFRVTCDRLRLLIARTGPMSIRDALRDVDHHYASHNSAAGALAPLIAAGKVPGLAMDTRVRPWRVTLAPVAPAEAVAS